MFSEHDTVQAYVAVIICFVNTIKFTRIITEIKSLDIRLVIVF